MKTLFLYILMVCSIAFDVSAATAKHAVYALDHDYLWIPKNANCKKVQAEFAELMKLNEFRNDPDVDFEFSAHCDFVSDPQNARFAVRGFIFSMSDRADELLRKTFHNQFFNFGPNRIAMEVPIQTLGKLEVSPVIKFDPPFQKSIFSNDMPSELTGLVAVPIHQQSEYVDELLAIIQENKPLERKEKLLDFLETLLPQWERAQLEAHLLDAKERVNAIDFSINPVFILEDGILEINWMSWGASDFCLPRGYQCFSSDPLAKP